MAITSECCVCGKNVEYWNPICGKCERERDRVRRQAFDDMEKKLLENISSYDSVLKQTIFRVRSEVESG